MNWKKIIFEFWNSSIFYYQTFDFANFINEFKKKLLKKLATHGTSSFKDYLKYIKKYYDFSLLENFTYKSIHTGAKWDLNDIKTLIFYPRYEFFRKKHLHNIKYELLKDLYKELVQWRSNTDIMKSVVLVDKCIDAEHNSGNILGLNIEELRKEYNNRKSKTAKFR